MRQRSAAFLVLVALTTIVGPAFAQAQEPGAPAAPTAAVAPQASHPVFLPLIGGPGGPLATAYDLITDAQAKGALDDVTALVYRIYAMFGDPRLPAQYRGLNPFVPEDPDAVAEARGRLSSLPPETQAILRPFLLPPYYQGSWDDQRVVSGGAAQVARAPAAGLPSDAPPALSGNWLSKGNELVKVWYQKDVPGDAAKADLVLNATADKIWPALTGLMQRTPLSDDAQPDNGGDARLDIAIVPAVPAGTLAVTLPYGATAARSAGYVRIANSLSGNTLLGTVAHEFMHTLQFTYNTQGLFARNLWLYESTATWAEDYVYPDLQTEQGFLPDYMDFPDMSLDRFDNNHAYGDYVFPFYLTHKYTPDLIRKIWEATNTNTSRSAVDWIIPGGFKERWPEFALYDWNKVPWNQFSQWDKVPRGVQEHVLRVPGSSAALTGVGSMKLSLPTGVDPLASLYYHVYFTSDDARSIALYNPFYANKDPDAKVQLLVKIGGAWQAPVDFTPLRGKTWCRDMKAERLEEMLLVISNSNALSSIHMLNSGPIPLIVTNVGCWRWTGTATGTYVTKGFWTMTTQAQVTFDRWRSPSLPDGSLTNENFHPIGDGGLWKMTGSESNCTYAGGPTDFPIGDSSGVLSLNNYATDGNRGAYSANGSTTQTFNYTVTCGGSTSQRQWIGASWLGTANQKFLVSDNGLTMDGTVVAADDSQHSQTYSWHLTAEREP